MNRLHPSPTAPAAAAAPPAEAWPALPAAGQVGAVAAPAWAARVRQVERVYRHIAATRMHGLPVLNARLQVQALGFAPLPQAADSLLGVLVTPWFMNLLRLPRQALASASAAMAAGPASGAASPVPAGESMAPPGWLAVGCSGERRLGGQALHFIGGQEAEVGIYEAASLFSPMFQFADQAAAVATAHEVLRLLRQAPPVGPGDAAVEQGAGTGDAL